MILHGTFATDDKKKRPLLLNGQKLSRITVQAHHSNHNPVLIGAINLSKENAYSLYPNHEVVFYNVMPQEIWVLGLEKDDWVSWIGS